ncbi:MAG: cytochrome P450 [Dehalococcoidia bacterium]|nr:cytochrome P450 [Dehalococcoidia bacterium]
MVIRELALKGAVRGILAWERQRTGVAFNPLGDVQVDPYPYLDEIREHDPVHWSYVLRGWLVSRHADVLEFLRDPATSKEMGNVRRRSPMADPRFERGPDDTASMLVLDPPDHTRLRSLASQAFTPRAVAALQPRIEEIARGLLDEVGDASEFDLMASFANQLPVIVIAEMLGVPPEDRGSFKAWSNGVAEGLRFDPTGERFRQMRGALAALTGYLAGIVAERRREPRADLISALVAAEEQGGRLSESEILSTLRLLLVAGNETTTNLIGNGTLALLRHPAELAKLRGDHSLLPAAIEEMLRYDSPVQAVRRIAMRDFEVQGRVIRAGDPVVCLLGAANRDPRAFEAPSDFRIERDSGHPVAFGHGIHYCLGAPLARLEGAIAFRVLLERYASIELAPPGVWWRDTGSLRGLARLPVRVTSPVGAGAST